MKTIVLKCKKVTFYSTDYDLYNMWEISDQDKTICFIVNQQEVAELIVRAVNIYEQQQKMRMLALALTLDPTNLPYINNTDDLDCDAVDTFINACIKINPTYTRLRHIHNSLFAAMFECDQETHGGILTEAWKISQELQKGGTV